MKNYILNLSDNNIFRKAQKNKYSGLTNNVAILKRCKE